MRLAIALALLNCLVSACVSSDPETQIILNTDALNDPSAEERNPTASTAWVGYGVARAAAYDELRAQGGADRASDDYPVEVAARATLAEIWKELKQKDGANPDAYLDALVRIQAAGFLEEYVVATFAKPGWTIPAEDLARFDSSAFGPWLLSSDLAKLESPTLARLSTDERTLPEPGAALPDPNALDPSVVPCADSARRLEDSLERWSEEANKLAGTPVSAGDRGEFFHIVGRFASLEPYKLRGMTWVSPKPFALAFYKGFCAIEVRDFRAAEKYLGQAVELAPYLPMPRLELAHVFVQRKEFERADAEIDGVVGSTEDRCTLGIALRKRGYIRFEQGRFAEARTAYLRSLDYDPMSKIAHSELKMIDREIAKAGGELPAPYQPPPSQTLVTECAPQ